MTASGSKPLIFWDFDGTLAFRGKLFASSLCMAMDELGAYPPIPVDDLVPLLKHNLPWHTPDIAHTDISSADIWWERLLYPALDGALAQCGVHPARARAISALSRQHAVDPAHYLVYDDTLPALELAAELGFRQFILSNHVPELPEIASALGLMEHAERCITSALAGYEKPHPLLYRLALEAAGNPRDVWMAGDSLPGDVLGAEAAGISAVLVRKQADGAKRFSPGLIGAVRIMAQCML